jgi:hypothetical protein
VAQLFSLGIITRMTQIASSEFDSYVYVWLTFECRDCESMLEPPGWHGGFDDAYFEAAARKAESDGWYISFDKDHTCLCPACRKKRGL